MVKYLQIRWPPGLHRVILQHSVNWRAVSLSQVIKLFDLSHSLKLPESVENVLSITLLSCTLLAPKEHGFIAFAKALNLQEIYVYPATQVRGCFSSPHLPSSPSKGRPYLWLEPVLFYRTPLGHSQLTLTVRVCVCMYTHPVCLFK